MRTRLILFFLMTIVGSAEDFGHLLPRGAQVVESAFVEGKDRALVLWMLDGRKVYRDAFAKEVPSCSDSFYGDRWVGKGRLSLLDTGRGRIINTVSIRPDEWWQRETIIPFVTEKYHYFVPKPNDQGEGVPVILHLRDLTGEGVKGQFVLFAYRTCGDNVSSSVLGYSGVRDRATQYQTEHVTEGKSEGVVWWGVYSYREEAVRPGVQVYEHRPGHGCFCVVRGTVMFDRQRQRFIDTYVVEEEK